MKIEKSLKNILFVAFKNAELPVEDFEIVDNENFSITHNSKTAYFILKKSKEDEYYITYNDSLREFSTAYNYEKLPDFFTGWCKKVKVEFYGEDFWKKAKEKQTYFKEEFENINSEDDSVFTKGDLITYNKVFAQLKEKVRELETNQANQAEILRRLNAVPVPKEGSSKKEWVISVRDALIGIALDRLLTKDTVIVLWNTLEPIAASLMQQLLS